MIHHIKLHLTPLIAGGLLLALLISLGFSYTYLVLIGIGMAWTYLRARDDNNRPPTPPGERKSDPASEESRTGDRKPDLKVVP